MMNGVGTAVLLPRTMPMPSDRSVRFGNPAIGHRIDRALVDFPV
jgi:hypothetical protein